MFQNFLISIVLVPILIGVAASNGRDDLRQRRVFRALWIAYGLVWFALLYYLRFRW